jgi:Uma2 family endonuclease
MMVVREPAEQSEQSEQLYTVADLEALYALPENQDKRFELITGEVIETLKGTFLHGYIIGEVSARFWLIARQHQLGYVFTDTVTYVLSLKDE